MSEIIFSHKSVMLDECIMALNIRPDGIYVDGTAGGGGHSYEIAARLSEGGRLIAIDRDISAIQAAKARLAPFENKVTFIHENFSQIGDILKTLDIRGIDGILLDLGVSSHQIDTADRGFSYMQDAPLDMRMNRNDPMSAYDVVNTYSHAKLCEILRNYGEENFAARIASFIVSAREKAPVETTGQLVELIKAAIPKKAQQEGSHPAKRTFQAIRIEVNGELGAIEPALTQAVEKLNNGGRIAVITFHSLEDRIVKQCFARLAKGCSCPPSFPVCVCGKKPSLILTERKPVLPSEVELAQNARSKSAKLRVAQKINA